jgi:hypothetical protein
VAGELQVEVVPFGVAPLAARALAQSALEQPAVKGRLAGAEAQVLSVSPAEGDDPFAAPSHVRAVVYDYGAEQALLVDVPVDGGPPAVTTSARQPLEGRDEREAALAILGDDEALGPELRAGRVLPYRPMPPLIRDELPTAASGAPSRSVCAPPTARATVEIVGVRLGSREVVRFEAGAPGPPASPSGAADCPTPASRR